MSRCNVRPLPEISRNAPRSVCLQADTLHVNQSRMEEEKGDSVQSNVTLCRLFEEDAVSVKKDGQFRCGVVLESSEYVSSDEDADDDICADVKLRRGTVRVAWHPEGTEEVVDENTVSSHLVSR